MDTINAIFSQLGADKSILIQFVVVIAMFILTKLLFFSKLQFVIENREEKTVKLEDSADETFKKVEELSHQYKEKIDNAYVEAQQFVNSKRAEITKSKDAVYKATEKELEAFADKSREEIRSEIQAKEAEILSKTDELSDALLQKLT